ncbi:MAG: proline racemase family protein, partial [Thermoplasmata archaeon]
MSRANPPGTGDRLRFVDSHTEGEPTRIIVAGGPDLGGGSVAERRDRLAREHDDLRRLVIGPPRGAAELVGGLRLPA